ncbi:ABC transporter substrate-binding protein [Kribbella sp. NPDC056861]|uniref:ABC transporter substrate-binding protein n=1 Tax=Kribbella sp. NPDC056861 TaxID=3154857 RepID=UPI003437E84F
MLTGGGATESIDPYAGGSPVDQVRHQLVFDGLFEIDDRGVRPALALSAAPSRDLRSVTIALRNGVIWHDGTELTPSDVLTALRYMTAAQRPYPSELAGYFDFARAAVTGRSTLVVPTRRPVGDPALLLAAYPARIVKPAGATPIGTGPYRVRAFAAGRETRLERSSTYWGEAGTADEIVLGSLTDPQAKVNAVRAGQYDYTVDIPFSAAKVGAGGGDLEIRSGGAAGQLGYGFVLNAASGPFRDPRARKAVRLGIDREALVAAVLLGYGKPGNDLFGAGAQYHDGVEPLRRDVDEARRLIRAAGLDGTAVVFRTAEYESGYNASTQLVAEQLKEIGLPVRVDTVGVPEFFDVKALTRTDALVFSIGAMSLSIIYTRLAAYPTLGLPDPALGAAVGTAMAATSTSERERQWRTVQQIMTDRGNTVVWGLADTLALTRRNVAGVQIRNGQPKYPCLSQAGLA